MTELTEKLIRTLRRAESEHLDDYNFANVQQSFDELLELEGLERVWVVRAYCTNWANRAENNDDNRVICFTCRDDFEAIWVREYTNDDSTWTPMTMQDIDARLDSGVMGE